MNYKKKIAIILTACMSILFMNISTTFAEDDWSVRMLNSEAREYENYDKYLYKIPYRLFIPENYNVNEKYPLLIFLNGGVEQGDDNIKQVSVNTIVNPLTTEKNKSKYPCFYLVPQHPIGVAWSSDANSPAPDLIEAVIEIIEDLKLEFSIDEDRIYVGGISDGASGTWDIIYRRPDLFAAAFPICGALNPSIAANIHNVPVWAFVSSTDNPYIVRNTRDTIYAMKQAGGTPLFTEYKYGGHNIWDTKVYKEPGFFEWLFRQKKNALKQIQLNINDVKETDYLYNDIYYLASMDVIDNEGNFNPDNNITFKESIEILIRSQGFKYEKDDEPLYDSKYINKARELNLIQSEDYIDFSHSITREQAAEIIYKAFNSGYDLDFEKYSNVLKDYDDIHPEYKQAVLELYILGIMISENEGEFMPEKNITRAEFASTVRNLIDVGNRKAKIDLTTEVKATSLEVIGQTPLLLNGERNNVRTSETNLGNLITDIIRTETGADIAVMQGGGIRATIDAGPITYRHIYNVLPFGNTVVALEIEGSDIISALENGVLNYPEEDASFLQVSGLTYTFDPNRPPGDRIVEVKIGGYEINQKKVYTLATNNYIAEGGDRFSMLKKYPVVRTYSTIAEVVCQNILEFGIDNYGINALNRINKR